MAQKEGARVAAAWMSANVARRGGVCGQQGKKGGLQHRQPLSTCSMYFWVRIPVDHVLHDLRRLHRRASSHICLDPSTYGDAVMGVFFPTRSLCLAFASQLLSAIHTHAHHHAIPIGTEACQSIAVGRFHQNQTMWARIPHARLAIRRCYRRARPPYCIIPPTSSKNTRCV